MSEIFNWIRSFCKLVLGVVDFLLQFDIKQPFKAFGQFLDICFPIIDRAVKIESVNEFIQINLTPSPSQFRFREVLPIRVVQFFISLFKVSDQHFVGHDCGKNMILP